MKMCFQYKLMLYEEMGNDALIAAFIFVAFISNPNDLSKLPQNQNITSYGEANKEKLSVTTWYFTIMINSS